jgi:hypothetical protein
MLAEHVEEWTEKWKREGLLAGRLECEREGRLEGERKGKLEGKRDTLKRLLGCRFGELPPWASACIDEASVAQLDAWVDGIFAAETLEILLNDSPPASVPSAV